MAYFNKYKETPTEELKKLLYAIDLGKQFDLIKAELDRRHRHKKVLRGLAIK